MGEVGGKKRKLRAPVDDGFIRPRDNYQLRCSSRHRKPGFDDQQFHRKQKVRYPPPTEPDKIAEMAVDHGILPHDSVVKVLCTGRKPDSSEKCMPYNSRSTGFVIGERRVLTNAHAVEHYTDVRLKRRGVNTIYVADILAVKPECDLALLTVDNDEFWKDISPVEVGILPAVQDAVTVVGLVGDSISMTSGVVSRLEFQDSSKILGMQIDAVINSMDSGGPVFNDAGKCVGISLKSLESVTWHVIPIPIIMNFIQDDVKTGSYAAIGNDPDELPFIKEEAEGDTCGGGSQDKHDDSVKEEDEVGDASQPPAFMVADASESPPAVVADAREQPTPAAEYFWHGHRVSQKCLDLLNAVEKRYPETFQGLQVRREKLWEIYLEIFEQVISGFSGICVGDLTPEIVARLRSDLDELTRYGFNICWASERLNDASKLLEGKEVEMEIKELEVFMVSMIHRLDVLKKEVNVVEAEAEKMKRLLETKREFIASLHEPSFTRLSSGCLGLNLV